jgi:hypothetical protein
MRAKRSEPSKKFINSIPSNPILVPSPLGSLVKPREGQQERIHFDMIAANEFCQRHGKELKELTPEEMQQFRVKVKNN